MDCSLSQQIPSLSVNHKGHVSYKASLKSHLQNGSHRLTSGQHTGCDLWLLAHRQLSLRQTSAMRLPPRHPTVCLVASSCLQVFLGTEGNPRTQDLSSLKLVKLRQSERSQFHHEHCGTSDVTSSWSNFCALPAGPVSLAPIMERPQL